MPDMTLKYPEHQEYANPFKWGWYYIDAYGGASGLMSKRAARKHLRELSRSGDHYGKRLALHPRAPMKPIRRITFPLASVRKSTNSG